MAETFNPAPHDKHAEICTKRSLPTAMPSSTPG